jgi:hypothetical protein
MSIYEIQNPQLKKVAYVRNKNTQYIAIFLGSNPVESSYKGRKYLL